MAEKPILFSGEMVRAILDGRKTVTRRVIKGVPESAVSVYHATGEWQDGKCWKFFSEPLPGVRFAVTDWLKCPYGRPGDLLWVREAFATNIRGCPNGLTYRADHLNPKGDGPAIIKWKPSIHMPRWVSRITLRVTDVRVERVQDISDKEAIKEGIRILPAYKRDPAGEARDAFAQLWDKINGSRGFGWKVNPWVFVIEFEKVKS